MLRIKSSIYLTGQANNKFKIPMTETRSLLFSRVPLCFEFVILVIGYYLLFDICNFKIIPVDF